MPYPDSAIYSINVVEMCKFIWVIIQCMTWFSVQDEKPCSLLLSVLICFQIPLGIYNIFLYIVICPAFQFHSLNKQQVILHMQIKALFFSLGSKLSWELNPCPSVTLLIPSYVEDWTCSPLLPSTEWTATEVATVWISISSLYCL